MPITIEVAPPLARGANDGDGQSFAIYHVSEVVEVYDPYLAQIVNHVFNHIHVLAVVASGTLVSANDFNTLAQYPRYEVQQDGSLFDSSHVMHLLREECGILLEYLGRYGALNNAGVRGRNDTLQFEALGAAAQERVPFLQFRYDIQNG